MNASKIVKWAAAAALAVASVPAIGLARSHASLPAALTSTPAELTLASSVTPVRASATKAKPKKVIHRKRTTRKHRAVRKSTRRHGKVSKTSRTSKHPVRKHRPVKHA